MCRTNKSDLIGIEIAKILGIKNMEAFHIEGRAGNPVSISVTIIPDQDQICRIKETIIKKYELVPKP